MARLVSSPTRSRRANGPIGKPQPPFIAVSMSSLVATPDSSSRMALFRYGNSSEFTMKPAWSLTSTGSLPQASANARASAMVSSLAVMGRTISTRAMTGAGLKKWMPQTRSGRPVSMASSTTGRVDVLVAMIVPSPQMRSSSLNRCRFGAMSSTMDSITRSQAASSPRSEVAVTRPRVAVRSSSESFPRSTCLPSDFSSPATMASAVACCRLRSTTSMPLRAAISAMPEPMMPEPTMPTRLMFMGGGYRWVQRRLQPAGGSPRVAAVMRDHPLFAAVYDRLTMPAEAAGLAERRRRLLSAARGRVLEVGAGTGHNLPHYQAGDVESVTLIEPDGAMRRHLAERLATCAVTLEVIPDTIEDARLDAGSFDTVVCTLVLCTVPDLDAAMARIRSLLRPDGRLLFLEHVRAPGGRGR